MPHAALPDELGSVFLVGVARRSGVSESRLRSRDLEKTFYGARAVVGEEIVVDAAADAARAYPRSREVRRVHERRRSTRP